MDEYRRKITEIAEEIAKANRKYNPHLHVISEPVQSKPRYKYYMCTLGFALLFITAMYGVSVTERAELSSQVSELKDFNKRPIPDLHPVTFAKYTVISPTDGCNGLFRHVGDSVECVGI